MKPVLVISFDAVGSNQLHHLKKLPNFSQLLKQSKLYDDLETVNPSNTYPIHTSISTGLSPKEHGITCNTIPTKDSALYGNDQWRYDSRQIKAPTLWDYAYEKGLKTAAVFWPVTGFSKHIQYNIPEAQALKEENQLAVSLKAGSKWTQIKAFGKHRKKLDGIRQPFLDNFSRASMCDILKKKQPDLALMHLTCYDTLCHLNGVGAERSLFALEHLDESLGLLLESAPENSTVIVFSDHPQITIHTTLNLNALINPPKDSFFYLAGGIAFFFKGSLSSNAVSEIFNNVLVLAGVQRALTPEEMAEIGFDIPEVAFGLAAHPGFHFEKAKYKGNHGYPKDTEDYKVFCMINDAKETLPMHSVRDIHHLIKKHIDKIKGDPHEI